MPAAVAGVRWDHTRREIDDFFLSDGDQTDERTFDHGSPRFGLLYDLSTGNGQLYANASKFFEAPLLLELNSFTVPGFIDLEAQEGWQFEAGARGGSRSWTWDVSVYDAEIDDEIININVEQFLNGQLTYRHPVGLTLRPSIEWIPGDYFVDSGRS